MAQRTIKWNGVHLNEVDKQGRKQGEWLFFDKQGNVLMNCSFRNDKVEGPMVFFDKGDTVLVRLKDADSLEHFIYYHRGEPISGAFVNNDGKFRIELDHLPANFTENDLATLKKWYAIKIEPVYMFGMQSMVEYFASAYAKSNTIANWNHNFVITINASGRVTNVEMEDRDKVLSDVMEREVYEMFYSMGRWQPFFDTWQTREIKLTMSLGADLQTITAR